MGPGFQVWKHHLEIRPWEENHCLAWAYDPWEESFSFRGLVFGGEEISMPETWPIQKSYNSHIVMYLCTSTLQIYTTRLRWNSSHS